MFSKKAEAPPAVSSFSLSNDDLTEVGAILGGLCLVHAIAFLIVPSVRKDFSKTPHLAAHFVATLVGFLAFAAQGTSLWLATPYLNNEPCVTDHIAGQCAEGARLAHAMMAFQTYEVLLALWVPKLRGPSGDMLVHHLATLTLATLGAGYGYLHHLAPFFFGLTELSSVPLAFMDLFKFYPSLKNAMPVTNENVRTAFVVIFIPIRIVYWPYICSEFWKDSVAELQSDTPRQPAALVLTFLVANVLLTGLQFFWGMLIAKGVMKKIKGQKDD